MKTSEFNPPDLPKTGQSSQYAYEACEILLRPLVSLALWFGLKYHDLDAVLRKLMLQEASRTWRKRTGKPASASQLFMTTGIHRKEIKRLGETPTTSTLPSSYKSITAKVFALWIQRTVKSAANSRIPIAQSGKGLSFEGLVNEISNDVHYRSALDELVRLGLANEENDHVKLITSQFVSSSAPQVLGFMSENVAAHLAAGVSNISEKTPLFLEQAVAAKGYALEDCNSIQETARASWREVRAQLLSELEKADAKGPPSNPHRMRIGMYVYFEPMTLEEDQS
jgi:Family of unknown function (DUF6502)